MRRQNMMNKKKKQETMKVKECVSTCSQKIFEGEMTLQCPVIGTKEK